MKRINFADLMGRDVIPLQTSEAQAALQRQIILVTGAAGSIGSELSVQLLNYEPERLAPGGEAKIIDRELNLRRSGAGRKSHGLV